MQGGRGRTPPEPMMEKLIQQAYDRGCTFFDTAEGYSAGSNEELLGRAVAPFRDKVIIGTKFTVDLTKNPPINDNRPERVKAACEGSLRRLKTDVIDLYHQHRIDRSVPIEDVAGAVADLIKEGKVRRFALSEVAADTIRRAHRVCPVTTVQSEYHLMFRKPETEVFSTLQELGISLTSLQPDQPRLPWRQLDRVCRHEHQRHSRRLAPIHARSAPRELPDRRGPERVRQDPWHDLGADLAGVDVVQASVHRPSVRNDQAGALGRRFAGRRLHADRG